MVAAKAVPNLLVATVIPAAGFIVGRHLLGLAGAVLFVMIWNGSCQIIRRLGGRRFSALLIIGLIELVVRTTLSLALNSAQAFFILPSVVTAITGLVFMGSGLTSTPLLTAVAGDLVPTSVLDCSDGSVARLLRIGSIVYGAEQMLVAGISIAMAVNVSPSTYVTVHPPVSWTVLVVVVGLAVLFFRRRLRVVAPLQPLALRVATAELAPPLAV